MAITVTKVLQTGYTATYARPLASPSLRLDTGRIELVVGLYKDAEARFADAPPAEYERHDIQLADEERETIAAVFYAAMARCGLYPDGEVRDPDPEKVIEETTKDEPIAAKEPAPEDPIVEEPIG